MCVWWLSKFSIYVVAFECVCVCVCVCVCALSHFSHVWLFVTPRAVADQALLSMGFSRQEYWSGLPFPPLGYLPDPGIEPLSPVSLALQADSLPTETPEQLLSILVLKCMVPKRWKREKWREKETDARDFPGGPLGRLCVSTAGGTVSISGLGTKILQAMWHGQRERNRYQSFEIPCRFCHLEEERFVMIAVEVATIASHLCTWSEAGISD